MTAFEVVTIVVSLIAIALSLTAYFRVKNVLQQLGRSAFAHKEDLPISEQPNEDERDEPIPWRPLRGQPPD
jgi:hypothetical protein